MEKIINWAQRNPIFFIGILVGAIILTAAFTSRSSARKGTSTGTDPDTNSSDDESYEDLASCLKAKGAKMYGSASCGYCKKQKEMLGNSPNIPYVECSGNPECSSLGIQSYPTWIFADGRRIKGMAPLEMLKEYAGCK